MIAAAKKITITGLGATELRAELSESGREAFVPEPCRECRLTAYLRSNAASQLPPTKLPLGPLIRGSP
jgi:hypothetical protein